jgi:hypothetical protein
VQRSRINVGKAQIVIAASSLTKAQWDAFLVQLNAFIAANPGLGLGVDRAQSFFQETPP